MCAESQVVIITVELSGVTVSTRELIHCRKLKIALVYIVIHHRSRHIQDTILARTVAVEKVVTEASLQAFREEVAKLTVATPEIVVLVNLLSLRKADVHPISLSRSIPSAVKHAPLNTYSRVVRALAFALHIYASTHAKKHVSARGIL